MKLVILLVLLILGSKCQLDDSALSLLSSHSPTKITVIISGGFNSCHRDFFSFGAATPESMGLAEEFSKLQKKFNTEDVEFKIIITCFGKSAGYLLVKSGDGKVKAYKSAEDFLNAVSKNTYWQKKDQLVLIGHSWGGWLSLKLAALVAGTNPIALLATIDPISYVDCGPDNISSSYLQSQLKVVAHAGCTRAPKDILPKQYRHISLNVASWLHYYQDNYPLLHSGGLRFAHHSEALEQSFPYFMPNQAHTKIDSDSRAWVAISRQLQRYLQ